MTKFAFLTDLHWGYEHGRKAIHNERALGGVMEFLGDFKPDTIILGGDMLDCSMLSHWNKDSRRDIEGLRLLSDAREFNVYVQEMRKLAKDLIYIVGNHEDWLDQLEDRYPGLDGMLDVRTLLNLENAKVIPQGGAYRLGKLWFIHGDQLGGGEHVAKKAVETYGRSVRFGHFHTAQLYTKMSALDADDIKTGMSVPSLCKRSPNYGKGAPNRWSNGFLWGYVQDNGRYNDYLTMIVNNQFVANGKLYKG